jgi:hypothetical protein
VSSRSRTIPITDSDLRFWGSYRAAQDALTPNWPIGHRMANSTRQWPNEMRTCNDSTSSATRVSVTGACLRSTPTASTGRLMPSISASPTPSAPGRPARTRRRGRRRQRGGILGSGRRVAFRGGGDCCHSRAADGSAPGRRPGRCWAVAASESRALQQLITPREVVRPRQLVSTQSVRGSGFAVVQSFYTEIRV